MPYFPEFISRKKCRRSIASPAADDYILLNLYAISSHINNYFMEMTQVLNIPLYLIYFMTGMFLSQIIEVFKRRHMWILLILINIMSFCIYMCVVYNADSFNNPNFYYGKYYYYFWVTSMFLVIYIFSGKYTSKVITLLSQGTFVVYMFHLPILLAFTKNKPITTTLSGIIIICLLFVGGEILSIIFKKMPLLRKLV